MTLRLFLLLLVAILSACAPAPPRAPAPPPTPERGAATLAAEAQRLMEAGKPSEAARLYAKAAALSPSPQRESLELEAAAALLTAGDAKAAQRTLDRLRERLRDPRLRARHRLLEAEVSLARRDPEQALVRLAGLQPEALPEDLRRRYLRLRVAALELSGQRLEAARARAELDPLLDDPQARLANQRDLLDDLTALGEERLRALVAQARPPMEGWLRLALLLRTVPDPLRLQARLRQWRAAHADHPALPSLIDTLVPPEVTRAIPSIHQIALLLPLQGPLQRAGEAIRDGFLAAYYEMPLGDQAPKVVIYDTAAGEPIEALYARAVAAGADRVIGPLSKQRLARLVERVRPQRPVLALNYLEEDRTFPRHYFFFGLSPRNEAEQVARRAWQDGHDRAVMIVPQSRWGERMATYFDEAWSAVGGELASAAEYPPRKSDFSKPIKRMLNLDQSEQRRRQLQRLLGVRLRFEPRRRQDVDFVFMAAFPRQARLIAPQLRFHHAADLPVYTTSHAYAGKRDPRADRDMNGVVLGDIPWLLEDPSQFPHLQAARELWPQRMDQYARLFALGADAYNLLFYLDWFRANPEARLRGATGVISMDDRHQMQRRLSWARFVRGVPRLLPPLVEERLP